MALRQSAERVLPLVGINRRAWRTMRCSRMQLAPIARTTILDERSAIACRARRSRSTCSSLRRAPTGGPNSRCSPICRPRRRGRTRRCWRWFPPATPRRWRWLSSGACRLCRVPVRCGRGRRPRSGGAPPQGDRRPPPGRSRGDPPARVDRSGYRLVEPPLFRRRPRRPDRTRGGIGAPAVAADDRHRPVQADQRSPRSRDRRQGAARGRDAAGVGASGRPIPSHASAATSSRW